MIIWHLLVVILISCRTGWVLGFTWLARSLGVEAEPTDQRLLSVCFTGHHILHTQTYFCSSFQLPQEEEEEESDEQDEYDELFAELSEYSQEELVEMYIELQVRFYFIQFIAFHSFTVVLVVVYTPRFCIASLTPSFLLVHSQEDYEELQANFDALELVRFCCASFRQGEQKRRDQEVSSFSLESTSFFFNHFIGIRRTRRVV
jgi:hypothetical protein